MTYHQFGHVDRDERIDYGEEPPPDDARHAVRPRIPAAVVAVVVMAVFAGGLWLAYHEGAKHAATGAAEPDKVPLIHADSDPVKVKPDKVGGMDIPDRNDPIYGVRPGGGRGVEKLLPPPEAPVARPTAPPPPAAAPPQAAPPPQPLTPQQVAALAKPPAKPAAAGAGMRVQLASLRTPEAAREEWTRLKRDNDDLLGNLTAIAVRADLGERGIYYRVEAGPVADKTTAQRLCKALKERDLECHLVQ
ncbi:MAG: SPOR domain-containing protein [Alphaproteobacteria bacterium]|nr:SPOR domain-containing protein [Alphaproteobacteria bacterium]